MLETANLAQQSATPELQETQKLFAMETFKPAMKADVGNEICICLCGCACV